jgi:cysteine desulfurase
VLLALGRPHEIAHGSLRLSINEELTDADVDKIIADVTEVVTYLRGISPIWRDMVEGRKEFVIK